MTACIFRRDPGSFRDPSGYVFTDGNRVVRSLSVTAQAEYAEALSRGLILDATERGLLIASKILTLERLALVEDGARGEVQYQFLEHPRVPAISYPYEWTFSQLKDAALRHLDLQLLALQYDFDLSDASAYNMQFHVGEAVHIDVLSLRRYRSGRPWDGYNQFCRQFLFPLLIESKLGLPFQRFYRGNISGIDVSDMVALLPAWKRFSSLNLLMHVQLQANALRGASSDELSGRPIRVPEIPKSRYVAMVNGLRDWIAGLCSGRVKKTYWANYAAINSYSDEEVRDKLAFVERTVRAWRSASVLDVGGNTGDYSEAALAGGASVAYCLDSDVDALEIAYTKRKTRAPGLLPLVVDWSDPSPGQGWAGVERRALDQRLRVDTVIALAVVHHIVFGGNVPVSAFVDRLFEHGGSVIVEFVPKLDPMVQGLLRNRDDIFFDYTEDNFIRLLEARSTICEVYRFRDGGRTLFACKRA